MNFSVLLFHDALSDHQCTVVLSRFSKSLEVALTNSVELKMITAVAVLNYLSLIGISVVTATTVIIYFDFVQTCAQYHQSL